MNKSSGLSILYLDDEKPNLFLFSIMLRNIHNVITYDNINDAMKAIDSDQAIDIIVSDMRMPRVNGLEFIKQAKVKRPDVRSFIVTGFDALNEIDEAIQAGIIDGHIRKPYTLEMLLKTFN